MSTRKARSLGFKVKVTFEICSGIHLIELFVCRPSHIHEVIPSAVARAVRAAMMVCTIQLQIFFFVSLSMAFRARPAAVVES